MLDLNHKNGRDSFPENPPLSAEYKKEEEDENNQKNQKLGG